MSPSLPSPPCTRSSSARPGSVQVRRSHPNPVMFSDLTLAMFQQRTEKKIEIKELVKELGGDYTEDLEEDVTGFLVAAKPEGEKYRAAREWNIPTVSLAWLEECERKKCKCLSLSQHLTA